MSASPDDGSRFAIASDLLADEGAGGWANLGCWPTDGREAGYVEACRELALRVGKAAALTAGDRVLDVGCGRGASLHLWPQAFAVQAVTGIEHQLACVEAIRAQPPAALAGMHAGRFDRLPLPDGVPAHGFDAVVCVDAAYHADSLAGFAAHAAAGLRTGGRLAFTTLTLAPAGEAASGWQRRRLRTLLALAGVPAASLAAPTALADDLTRQGFANVGISHLNAEVLGGFAAFAARRGPALPWYRRLSPGWRKISLSADFCRYLQRSGLVDYSLVQATYIG